MYQSDLIKIRQDILYKSVFSGYKSNDCQITCTTQTNGQQILITNNQTNQLKALFWQKKPHKTSQIFT